MKSCPKCNAQLSDEARFCENCGTKLDAITTCPSCGKSISSGARFCMHCGSSVYGTAPAPNPVAPPEKKNRHIAAKIFGTLFLIVLAAAAYGGYRFYAQHQEKIRLEEQKARELEIADSLAEVQYEEELRLEKLKQEEEHRIEDLKVFVASLYGCRGEYRDKILKYYSSDLRRAYRSWENDELQGPQALLFEKKWEEGCGKWNSIRNYKKEVVEAESPTDSIATVQVKVTFALYTAEDDEFMETDSHDDVFHFIYEGGEWKIDDLVRDGKSSKDKYKNGSADYGKEVC